MWSGTLNNVAVETPAAPACLRSEVMQMRASARAEVARNRAQRRSMARQMRQTLLAHRANVRAELARGQRGAGTACSAETLPPAQPPATRSDDWILSAEPQPYRRFMLGPPASSPAQESTGDEQVLQLIQSHPEGIGIVDLGNELGVDWRGLVGPTDRLLTHGDIEHVQQLFYPVAE